MLFRRLEKKYYGGEEDPLTEEQKDAIYKRGIEAGSIGAGAGALVGGLGAIMHKTMKNSKNGGIKVTPGRVKAAKGAMISGATSLGVGAGLAGYSAYKHHKYKKSKKDDNSKK